MIGVSTVALIPDPCVGLPPLSPRSGVLIAVDDAPVEPKLSAVELVCCTINLSPNDVIYPPLTPNPVPPPFPNLVLFVCLLWRARSAARPAPLSLPHLPVRLQWRSSTRHLSFPKESSHLFL